MTATLCHVILQTPDSAERLPNLSPNWNNPTRTVEVTGSPASNCQRTRSCDSHVTTHHSHIEWQVSHPLGQQLPNREG